MHTYPLKTCLTAALLALSFIGLPGVASAATCSVSATAVDFNSYDTLSNLNTDSTGTVTVACSGVIIALLVNYTINLSKGGSGTYSSRYMTGPSSNHLNYNLYTNSPRTTVWGDSTGGTSTISDGYLVALGTVTRNYTVYGRIPSRQNVVTGFFTDTITVTVNY